MGKNNFLIITLILLGLSACQTVPNNDLAIRFFNDIAFRASASGYPVQGKAMLDSDYFEHRMYRWEKNVRVTLKGEIDEAHQAFTKSLINRMGELSNRKIEILPNESKDANFQIEFSDLKNFNIRDTESVPCYAHRKGEGEIEKISIKISVQEPELIRHCIAHELFHGFGFAHSDLMPSVISSQTREEYLTIWDELMLQVLYDPRLKSGMSRQEAMPLARKILLELKTKTNKSTQITAPFNISGT